MSITDELRECIATAVWQYENDIKTAYIPKDKLTAIADRIDERHAKARDKAYDEGVNDGIDADKNAMGYVKGPVDADWMPIRLCDEMELTDEAASRWDGNKHFGKVMELELTADGWAADGEPAANLRHVKPDTWERIIEDAAKLARGDNDAVMELVDRCRRLAGER